MMPSSETELDNSCEPLDMDLKFGSQNQVELKFNTFFCYSSLAGLSLSLIKLHLRWTHLAPAQVSSLVSYLDMV